MPAVGPDVALRDDHCREMRVWSDDFCDTPDVVCRDADRARVAAHRFLASVSVLVRQGKYIARTGAQVRLAQLRLLDSRRRQNVSDIPESDRKASVQLCQEPAQWSRASGAMRRLFI